MNSSAPVRGVVLAHGPMAEGLTAAVKAIAGNPAESLIALSNEGETPESLCTRLNELLGENQAILFVDLSTGSCALTGRRSCLEHPQRAVIFGVNLPMLLDFVFHQDLPMEELVPRLVGKGRDAVGRAATAPDASHAPPG